MVAFSWKLSASPLSILRLGRWTTSGWAHNNQQVSPEQGEVVEEMKHDLSSETELSICAKTERVQVSHNNEQRFRPIRRLRDGTDSANQKTCIGRK